MTDFDKEVRELLNAAMQQPGVVEAVRIIEQQQSALRMNDQAQQLMAPVWAHAVTSSSETVDQIS
jgi:hypothetical protein